MGSMRAIKKLKESMDWNENVLKLCEECGELIHMDCSFLETILGHFMSEHGFAVDCGRTVIYGTCASCREKAERTKRADPDSRDADGEGEEQ